MQVSDLQNAGRVSHPGTRGTHSARVSNGGSPSDWQYLHELALREVSKWLPPTDCRRARLVCKHWQGALDTVTTAATTPSEGGTVSRWKACLESMTYSLPCLKEVTVSGKLSDVGAQQLSTLAGCRQLRTLRIAQGQSLHDTGIQALQLLTQLEVLHIYAAPSLTGRALCTLSILGKLRTLDLRGCNKISWVDLQQAWVAACVAYRQRDKQAPAITVRRKSSNGGHYTGMRHLTLLPGGHSHSSLARTSSGGGNGGSPRAIMKQRHVMFAASAGMHQAHVPARLGRKSSNGGMLQSVDHEQEEAAGQGQQQQQQQQQEQGQQQQQQQQHVSAPLLRRKSGGSVLRHHHLGLRAQLHHMHARQPSSGGGAPGLARTPSGMPTAGMLRQHLAGPAGQLGGSSLVVAAAASVARQKSSMQAALLAYMAGDYDSDEDDDDTEGQEDSTAATFSATIGSAVNGSYSSSGGYGNSGSYGGNSRAKVLSAPPAMPFPRLQSLCFTCSEVFSSRPAAELKAVAAITTLTTLELLRCRHISDKALLELASLPRLSKLKLSGAWSLTDAGVEALASELGARLTSLVMLNPVQLTGRGVLALGKLRGLAHLGLCITQDVGQSPLLQLLAMLPRLRSFDLTYPNWNDECCEGLAGAVPALVSLKLHGCASLSAVGVAAMRGMTALTALSFEGCKALHAGALLMQGLLPQKLASLSLQGSPFGNMYGSCMDLPACAGSLTRLELLSCNDLHDAQLRKVVSFYPALQELSLAGCVSISDAGAAAATAARQLRTLDLSGTRVLGAFAEALAGLRSLVRINMRNCSALGDPGLRQLAAALPQLQVLEVAECGGITDRAVAALFEMGCLGRLDVTGCKKVTCETLLCAPHTLRVCHTLSAAASGHGGR